MTQQWIRNLISAALALPLAAGGETGGAETSRQAPALDPFKADTVGRAQPPEGYRLVWHDEFNGEGEPDPAKWSPERGFVRNREMQWYRLDNARQSGGRLIITGKKESFPNPDYEAGSKDWRKNRKRVAYTSASLTTKGKFSVTYGILEARVRFKAVRACGPPSGRRASARRGRPAVKSTSWSITRANFWPISRGAQVAPGRPSGAVER